MWKTASEGMVSTMLDRVKELTHMDLFLVKGWWNAIYEAAEKTIKEDTDKDDEIIVAIKEVTKSVCKAIPDQLIQAKVMYEFVYCEMMLLINLNKSRREWLSRKHDQAGSARATAPASRAPPRQHDDSRDDTSSEGSVGDRDCRIMPEQHGYSHRGGHANGRGGRHAGQPTRGGAGRDHRQHCVDKMFGPASH